MVRRINCWFWKSCWASCRQGFSKYM